MTRDDMKIMSWANKGGIYIYPVPVEGSKGKFRPKANIVIDLRGRIHWDKSEYTQDAKLTDKIIEYYKYYYDKNHR